MNKVVIILPVYNNSQDISNAINSVINQTYKNWELIIINDASTDKEQLISIFSKYERNKKIKIIHNEINKGCYWCLNYGIQNSESEYITRIDSDDRYHKNKLEEQIEFLNKNKNYLGIFVESCLINYPNKIYPTSMAPYMMRRSIIEKIGYYDSVRFGADLEYKKRMFLYYGKDKFKKMNKTLYYIKKRNNSLTKNKNIGMYTKPREDYNKSFIKWHENNKNKKEKLYIEYPQIKRPFEVHSLSL